MKLHALTLAPALFTLILLTGPALANDGIASVSMGGIVFRKTDAIAMKKEVLTVSHDLIAVDYEFRNETGAEVEETIVFPLPAYPVMRQSSDSYYGRPARFSVLVDGRPVAYTMVIRALQGKRDVTADLRKAGLNDVQIAYNPIFAPTVKEKPLTARQTRELDALGLIGESPEGGTGPDWEAQVNYVWQQKFAPGKVVRVHHEYRPFIAAGPGESWIDPDFKKRYCADDAFFKTYQKIAKRNEAGYVNAAHVSYILKTGNTWKRGIEDFTLNVVKRDPSEVVSLCFPGTFSKVDAKTYQIRLSNFKPAANLEIYFGNVAHGGPDNNGVMPIPAR